MFTSSPTWRLKMRVLCKAKSGKNIIFQNKTLLVMFYRIYRHNNTFWYQFCNSKHFLKIENSEDSLVSWCEEFCGGGALECRGEYQARPKIHVIKVVFQDQALYARTSFRGAKPCKIGKKGVFLVISSNFGKDMKDKLRKMHAKTRI